MRAGTALHRLEPGYSHDDRVRELVGPLRKAAPLTTLRDGLLFVLSLVLVSLLVAVAMMQSAWWVLLVIPALIFSARQLRALELIVHDASHENFIAKRPILNALLANILFAAPVMQLAGVYWKTHKAHHSDFGGRDDPCRRRMADKRGGFRDIERTPLAQFPLYILKYYQAAASEPACLAAAAVWHLTAATLFWFGINLLVSIPAGAWAAAWLVVWIVPILSTLPLLRMIAEAEEHDYGNGATEFSATISNLGLWHRLLIHPWHDGYHLLHHMFPKVPQCRHPKLHRLLMEHDATYRNGLVRHRLFGPYRTFGADGHRAER